MTLPSGSTLPSSSSVLWRVSPTRVTCAFAWPDLLIVPRSIKGLAPPPPLLVIQLSFSEQKVLLTQPYTIHPKQLSNRHHQQQHYLPLNTTPALSTIRDIPRVVISYSGTTHNPQPTTHFYFKRSITPTFQSSPWPPSSPHSSPVLRSGTSQPTGHAPIVARLAPWPCPALSRAWFSPLYHPPSRARDKETRTPPTATSESMQSIPHLQRRLSISLLAFNLQCGHGTALIHLYLRR